MAKQAKKFSKVIRDLESIIGAPVLTGPRDGELSALFVVLFGRLEGASRPSVLGRGELASKELVLAAPDAAAALRDGATPTSVGIAWLSGDTPHSQLRAVGEFGPRDGEVASEADMWMIELATPSTVGPVTSFANGWCMLFPWLSMCHKN
ncbi:hypothetical protein [Micropruina sp.]|uniref:hypothetical protein n=1 Tax=Micropruina sp. TaxID=2737536 RepID=UPI0039E5A4AD